MYQSVITYPISELNSSFFLEKLRNVLEIELLNQRNIFNKTFLPQTVKKDNFLLNPINDVDLNPSFCAVAKARAIDNNQGFNEIKLVDNTYFIRVAAYGLENTRKIQDSIYQILNDLDVKAYFFQLKRETLSGNILQNVTYLVQYGESITYNGDVINTGESFTGVENFTTYIKTTGSETVVNPENDVVFDDGNYVVNQTDIEVDKTTNDLDLIIGSVQITVPISENAELNKTTPIEIIKTDLKLGEDQVNLTQQSNI